MINNFFDEVNIKEKKKGKLYVVFSVGSVN